jgi:transcriptional regulator with XRE-family HTH domain
MRGLKQEEPWYARIETGRAIPRPQTVKAICRVLKLHPDTLEPIERTALDDFPKKDIDSMDEAIYWEECVNSWIDKYHDELDSMPAKE